MMEGMRELHTPPQGWKASSQRPESARTPTLNHSGDFKCRLEDTGETAKGFRRCGTDSDLLSPGHSGCSYENERDAGWQTGESLASPCRGPGDK